jgi:mannose PTS system EIIA component
LTYAVKQAQRKIPPVTLPLHSKMIALLIVAHGNLGDSLIQCATFVLGKRPAALENLDLSACEDPAEMLARARAKLAELDQGEGVLVLTDVYGATPCNIVRRVIASNSVEAISGVNLPMLLKALTYRDQGMARLVEKAVSGGQAGIINIQSEPACD